jgi:hypothetical protein
VTGEIARPLAASAQRVQDALDAAGVAPRIVEYDAPARTSAEAAAVLGCEVGQIAKSLVFRSASGVPVLVIASGAHRVDEATLAKRRAAWKPPKPRYTRGLLAKYMRLVSTASKGAITDGVA